VFQNLSLERLDRERLIFFSTPFSENFTRVETFGDNAPNGTNDVNWLKVTVDPGSREVFSYQAMIVPGNRTAVPAP